MTTKKSAKTTAKAVATKRPLRARAKKVETLVQDTTTTVAEEGAQKGQPVWDALKKDVQEEGNPRYERGRLVRDLTIEVK